MVRFWKSTNQGAEPMPQEILPPLPAVVAPGAEPAPDPAIDPALDPDHHPPALPFPPPPPRSERWTGITAPKQRARSEERRGGKECVSTSRYRSAPAS